MKRTVTVLQDDIDNGQPKSPRGCPIANAARRDLADLLGDECVPAVGLGSLRLVPENYRPAVWRAALPLEARIFVAQFDLGSRVEAFKFEVELEEP